MVVSRRLPMVRVKADYSFNKQIAKGVILGYSR